MFTLSKCFQVFQVFSEFFTCLENHIVVRKEHTHDGIFVEEPHVPWQMLNNLFTQQGSLKEQQQSTVSVSDGINREYSISFGCLEFRKIATVGHTNPRRALAGCGARLGRLSEACWTGQLMRESVMTRAGLIVVSSSLLEVCRRFVFGCSGQRRTLAPVN